MDDWIRTSDSNLSIEGNSPKEEDSTCCSILQVSQFRQENQQHRQTFFWVHAWSRCIREQIHSSLHQQQGILVLGLPNGKLDERVYCES